MKKNLLLTGLLALALGTLSSCGSDDEAALTEGTNHAVTFTLMPEQAAAMAAKGAATRADGDTYYYRYKMSVYNTNTQTKIDNTDAVQTRKMTSIDPVTFTVDLPIGTAYTCVFWADMVTDPTGAKDIFYNTSDLKNITSVRSDMPAYQGTATIDEYGQASASFVTLKHAVAQLNIKTTATLTAVGMITMGYINVPTGINALTGEVTQFSNGGYGASAPHTVATPENPVDVVTLYLLAPAEGMTLDGVTINMFTAENVLAESITIPNVPLKRNYRTNIIGDFGIMQTNEFGVHIFEYFEGEGTIGTEPEAVKVGSYYYSDGTWSEALNPLKTCIGVVFYAGKHETDTDTYTDLAGNTMTDFHGYAVALQDASPDVLTWGPRGVYCGTSTNDNDYRGYFNQQQIVTAADGDLSLYPAVNACARYPVAAPQSSSGWFLPSASQLKEGVYDANENIVRTNITNAGGDDVNGGRNDYYWSSTEFLSGNVHAYSFYSNNYSACYKSEVGYVRPVIAF